MLTTTLVDEAIELYKQLKKAFNTVGCNLRKFISNSSTLMKYIPEQIRTLISIFLKTERKVIKLIKREFQEAALRSTKWSNRILRDFHAFFAAASIVDTISS